MAPLNRNKIREFPATPDADAILKAFQEDGCVIIKGLIPRDQVKRLNNEIEPEMRKIPVAATHDSAENVKIFSRLMTTSPTFPHEEVELCERTFGQHGQGMGYHFNDTIVIELHPGAAAQPPEAVINFFFALTPFTEENVHAGGHNSTATEQRRGLALAVIRSELHPLQAFTLSIPPDLAKEMSKRTQAMFGFRSSAQKVDTDTIYWWGDSGRDIAERLGLKASNWMSNASAGLHGQLELDWGSAH
ncbi:hypothetical protein CNMCM7691_000520 [Aspergillus felis]|uniref:Uncharacterized protein n=1 Tax=Aspergillus felis TaxID=1287682 RepID=A0A8H6V888_9EURO|nr:hypothetical protein CNMCM7691_000520 [Aspergillus felis]